MSKKTQKAKVKADRKTRAEESAKIRSVQRRAMLFAIGFLLLGTWCLLCALNVIGDGTGRLWRGIGAGACYFCMLQMLAQIVNLGRRR